MNVIKVGDVYKATRITGPQHNFLGLVLSETAIESVIIEPLSVDASEIAVETVDRLWGRLQASSRGGGAGAGPAAPRADRTPAPDVTPVDQAPGPQHGLLLPVHPEAGHGGGWFVNRYEFGLTL